MKATNIPPIDFSRQAVARAVVEARKPKSLKPLPYGLFEKASKIRAKFDRSI